MARLGPSLQEHRDCVVLHLTSLEKQARAGHVRGFLRIPSFPADLELCPVRALTAYYNKVLPLRGDTKAFFVSFVTPFKSVTSRTLARWLKTVLEDASVDTSVWDPHALRSASSAHHKSRNLDLGQICRLADWSTSSGVFKKFYDLYV